MFGMRNTPFVRGQSRFMHYPNLVHSLAAFAALALVPVALGTNYTSSANGNWNDQTKWSPTGVPGTGDRVAIQNGHVITVTDSRAITGVGVWDGRIEIQQGGVLTINGTDEPTLTVDAGNYQFPGLRVYSGGALVIAATMTWQGDGVLGVLSGGLLEFNTASTTVTSSLLMRMDGIFRVSADDVTVISYGEWDDAVLEIGASSGSGTVDFTHAGEIYGSVTIKRNGHNANAVARFKNDGRVIANGGLVLLDSTLSLITDSASNCSGPSWTVNSGGTMQFSATATGLAGNFSVAGSLDIGAKVQTSGLFAFATGGAVNFPAEGPTFDVTGTGGVGSGNHYCSGSACNSASFPYSSTVTCQ